MIRWAVALALIPAAASADLVLVEEKDIEFPRCEISLETAFGPAKVERSLHDGKYFLQFIYWAAQQKQLTKPFSLNLLWRKSRTSGLSDAPIFLVGMYKNAAGNKKRFAKGSSIRVLPDAANISQTKELIYGPLTEKKSEYREDFELDVAEIADKFAGQEILRIQILAPPRKGREPKIIASDKLKMDFVRTYLTVASDATATLDMWQRNGGYGCTGIGR